MGKKDAADRRDYFRTMPDDPSERARRLRQKAGLTLNPRAADVLRMAARKYEEKAQRDA